MNGLERDYSGRLQVVRLDFNSRQNERAIRALGVRVHPTIVLIDRRGRVQPLILGTQTDELLRPKVAALVTG